MYILISFVKFYRTIPGVPKSRTLDFRYFDIRKYIASILISSHKTLSSENNDTKIIESG